MTDPVFVVVGVAFLFGAVIGSFLGVIIFRLPRQIPFARGRSCCPHCGALICWYHNIPLVSYFVLRGRCARCREKISPRYPLVELLTGVAFAGWVYRFGVSMEALGYIYLSCLLICVFFIDWEFQIIPDKLTYPSLVLGLVWSLFSPLGVPASALGLLVGGGGLLLVAMAGDWIFKKESMGGGDIKLAAVLGAFLGWRLVVLVFFLSALIGAVAAIVWMACSPRVRKSRIIPFGPFLAAAAVLAAAWGHQMIHWYLRHFWST